MPQPLPANPYPAGSRSSDAYIACLNMEGYTLGIASPACGPSTLICARLLGYMLLNAPTQIGHNNIANEVSDCRNLVELGQVACKYIDNFLRCFRSTKGPTPAPSNHASRPSFDNVQDTFRYLTEEAPADHRTAKELVSMSRQYSCLSLMRDIEGPSSLVKNVPGALQSVAANPLAGSGRTQLAHIFFPSTNENIGPPDEETDKRDYAARVWAVMECFGQVNGFLELNGPNIHRLENVMTMTPDVHASFEALEIWLEARPVIHTYNMRSIHPTRMVGLPATVTFTSSDPRLSLPDPRYLALHAACAQVAHLSGAAEYIETMYRKLEDMKVLASNGSSADTLSFALGKTYTTFALGPDRLSRDNCATQPNCDDKNS